MIEVLSTPPLNSVQDLGRTGFRHYGLGQAGAMDDLALTVGNLMLGNPAGAAGIEVQMFPFTLRVNAAMSVAVTGGRCGVTLGSRVLPPWWSVDVGAGEVLTITPPAAGARAYITVRGGIDVPVVLGSRSTDLRTRFGGLGGRPIQPGDVLRVGPCPDDGRGTPGSAGFGVVPPEVEIGPSTGGTLPIRVLPGPEYDLFPPDVTDAFWGADWTLGPQGDRMGIRLRGPKLSPDPPVEIRSGGIVVGVVQVPPAGEPIIQLRDGNSAGGYPRIGVVIRADLWRLGQARPGQPLSFRRVDHAEALAAERPIQHYLDRVQIVSRLCRPPPRASGCVTS